MMSPGEGSFDHCPQGLRSEFRRRAGASAETLPPAGKTKRTRAVMTRDGAAVWLVEARHLRMGPCRLWIDRQTFAIRRLQYVEEELAFSFSPSVNEVVDASEL